MTQDHIEETILSINGTHGYGDVLRVTKLTETDYCVLIRRPFMRDTVRCAAVTGQSIRYCGVRRVVR